MASRRPSDHDERTLLVVEFSHELRKGLDQRGLGREEFVQERCRKNWAGFSLLNCLREKTGNFADIVISQLDTLSGFESKMFGRLVLLFSALTFLLLGFALVIGYILGLDPISMVIIALVLSILINVATYAWSDKLVLWSTHTKLISQADNPQLYSIVQNVAARANIPMPRVGIVESQQPNAFATGKGPDKAIVVATTGILRTLTPSELEAVIGHEISHVTHRDVLVASVAAAIAGTVSFLGQIIFFNSFFFGGSRGRNNNGNAWILLIIAAVLIPIGATLVQLGSPGAGKATRTRRVQD